MNQRKTTRVKLLLQAPLSSLRELVVAVATRAIYSISGFLPRRKNIWIFGSWDGKKFADNPKYLFLYVYHKQPEITGVWLSRNKTILPDLRERGYKAYYMHSLRGILYSMRASCIIFSVGVSDVNLYTTKGTKSVQLWHGTPLRPMLDVPPATEPKAPVAEKRAFFCESACARRQIRRTRR